MNVLRWAVFLALICLLAPTGSVAQFAPYPQSPELGPIPGLVPGPGTPPPLPQQSPPAFPADSILLRLGGARPDACSGVNYALGNAGRISLPPDYRIGPGDMIDIQLAGRLEVTRQQVMVDPEGNITVPPVGSVNVDRLTVIEAQRKLNEMVRTLFRYSDAALSIPFPRCFEVVLTGEVERPGTTQASAMRRVHEVILLAGGITPRGSVRYISVISKDGATRSIDLLRYEMTGESYQNPLVEEGVRIHVPPRYGYVTLSGAVRRPGTFELSRDGGLRELLDLTGGMAQGAAEWRARLTRVGTGGVNETRELDLVKSLAPPGDVAMVPGDVLYVPPGTVLQEVVEVRGAFNGTPEGVKSTNFGKPTVTQRFELAQGDRVRDVLVKAGGPSPLADLRLAVIDRGGAAGPRRQIPVDLRRLLVDKEEFENILLENGDVFTLPPLDDRVFIVGEVRVPGPQDYRPGVTIREYLALAGGPTIRGRFKNATVTYRDGRTFNVAQAPPLEAGSIITVPEVSVRWWQDYVTISNAITGLLSSYANLFLLFGGSITTTVN